MVRTSSLIRVTSTDPRARRSKDALETALLDLAAAHDLTQISVSDITKQAGVSRSTFYEHYTDVHELAALVCTSVFDRLVASQPMAPPLLDEANNPLTPIFRHFGDHAQLYRSLLGPDGSARVVNHLLHRMRVGTYANLRPGLGPLSTHADDPEETPEDPDSAFIAGALVGVVVDWLHHDTPVSAEALAETVYPQLLAAVTANGLDTATF
jgi:AcrR family transcriptional regulator